MLEKRSCDREDTGARRRTHQKDVGNNRWNTNRQQIPKHKSMKVVRLNMLFKTMVLRVEWVVERTVKNPVLKAYRNFQWLEQNPNCTRYSPVTGTKGPSQHRLCSRQFLAASTHQEKTHRPTIWAEQHNSSRLFDEVV